MSTQKEVIKEESMLKQKAMIARNYDAITSSQETGRKVVSTFVPGNLNELIMSFGMLNSACGREVPLWTAEQTIVATSLKTHKAIAWPDDLRHALVNAMENLP